MFGKKVYVLKLNFTDVMNGEKVLQLATGRFGPLPQ